MCVRVCVWWRDVRACVRAYVCGGSEAGHRGITRQTHMEGEWLWRSKKGVTRTPYVNVAVQVSRDFSRTPSLNLLRLFVCQEFIVISHLHCGVPVNLQHRFKALVVRRNHVPAVVVQLGQGAHNPVQSRQLAHRVSVYDNVFA